MAFATLHQFRYIKKEISLWYGLGMDMVHQDFTFQLFREKSLKDKSRGWQTLDFAFLFWHFASQVTRCCNSKALDSRRRLWIGNAPLVTKATSGAERSIHGPQAAGKVHFSLPLSWFKSVCRGSLITGGWVYTYLILRLRLSFIYSQAIWLFLVGKLAAISSFSVRRSQSSGVLFFTQTFESGERSRHPSFNATHGEDTKESARPAAHQAS